MVNSAIVTIRIPDQRFEKDLECSLLTTIGSILQALFPHNSDMQSDTINKYVVFAEPQCAYISMTETLESYGIWDGSILTFKKK